MTQETAILSLLRQRPHTTSEIIQAPYGLAAEFRRAISTLRKRGYEIRYTHGRGGTGSYALVSEPPTVDVNGQMRMADAGGDCPK